NEIELQLVEIWQELLGVDRVGIYDNFFELGGHSLLATRLVSIIRKKLEIEIEIGDIFEFTSVEQLSSYIHYKVINFSDSTDQYNMNIDI
ncbi:phosphopantetheine-binding protein, partial [Aquimarina muelleri]